MLEIEEVIADAKAEEEVQRDNFREGLKDTLNAKKEDTKVSVDLTEYVLLKQKEKDLDRLVNIIIDDAELNYTNDGLRLKDYEELFNAFKVLYPEAYDHLLKNAKHDNEGE